MFQCHACLRRHLRLLAEDVHLTSAHLQPPQCRSSNYLSRRPFSQISSVQERPPAPFHKKEARPVGVKEAIQKDTPTIKHAPEILRELDFLPDPVKLALRVQNYLENGNEEKAFALTRAASPRMECTVCWNHLIGYLMTKGHVANAMKTYNEMKKRAQKPDSVTYIIALRGLADNALYPQSVERALSIYNSMFNPNSPLPPRIAHSNAALKVCARAGNTDAMWGIVGRLPETGPASPDSITFTTILNVIRGKLISAQAAAASQNGKKESPKPEMSDEEADWKDQGEHDGAVVESLMDARRVWANVVRGWQSGQLTLDERLVSTMGRILLFAPENAEVEDVFDLLEESMNIPNLQNQKHLKPPAAQKKEGRTPHQDELISKETALFSPLKSNVDPTASPGQSIRYATPTPNTISVIMEACLRLRNKKLAVAYWDLLTGPDFNVVPDADNLHALLRILRHAHASSEAITYVREFVEQRKLPLSRTIIKILMPTCSRNRRSPHAVGDAGQLVDWMSLPRAEADPDAVLTYVSMAYDSNDADAMVAAVDRANKLAPVFRGFLDVGGEAGVRSLQRLRSKNSRESTMSFGQNKQVAKELQSTVAKLYRKVLGTIHRLLNTGHWKDGTEEQELWQRKRTEMSAWVPKRDTRPNADGAEDGETGSRGRPRYDTSRALKPKVDQRKMVNGNRAERSAWTQRLDADADGAEKGGTGNRGRQRHDMSRAPRPTADRRKTIDGKKTQATRRYRDEEKDDEGEFSISPTFMGGPREPQMLSRSAPKQIEKDRKQEKDSKRPREKEGKGSSNVEAGGVKLRSFWVT
ncbi:hypothetical protein K402DRAFT_456397 [Aulographum hederae CBS 113979]|uniref:Pentatricopeptide repeat protein n=1 Tax=Aulographum hederae CBS 113979 TaxID=1176131 RepID=A0A6G1GS84_9PEZI|nr:hypothetical protein K402DRAFT_456397 [Aulographum hederae CBS 113979]